MDEARVGEMLRVDHAGEVAAVAICEGWAAGLSGSGDERLLRKVEEMAKQEREHLERVEGWLRGRGVRSSALEPLWRILGYGLGAMSGLAGSKAAMTCADAVEEVIGGHYEEQARELEGEGEEGLREGFLRLRDEEREHQEEAREEMGWGAGGIEGWGLRLAAAVVRVGCRGAIKAAERF